MGQSVIKNQATPPAGANTEIQFNNAGAFGANANFAWDNTNKRLYIKGVGAAAGIPLHIQNNTPVDIVSLRDDGILTLPLNSGARAYRSGSSQSIPLAIATKCQYNAETYDIQSEYDSAVNYRFTAKVAGYYLVIGQVSYDGAVDGNSYRAIIYKNGAQIACRRVHAATNAYHIEPQVTDVVYLAANDYLELWTYITAGPRNINFNEAWSFFTIAKIR